MSRASTLELCKQHLYTDKDRLNHLPEQTRNRLIRIRSGYTLMMEFPSKKSKDIAMHLMQQYNIEKSVAYDDVRLIQDLMGSLQRASKDWHLYNFNQKVHKAYDMAEAMKNPGEMVKAMAAYGKFNQLDQADETQFPWETVKPQQFEMTENPEVLGIKRIPNVKEKIAKLFEKYKEDIQTVEDVTYEDVDIDFMQDEEFSR